MLYGSMKPGTEYFIQRDRFALLLDIDGTLLDIAARPDAVQVPERLLANLARILEHLDGALALVSGRPIQTIDELFSPLTLPAIGCHGAELRPKPGLHDVLVLAPPLSVSLRARMDAIAARYPGVSVEDKVYSLALHYRNVPHLADALRDSVQAIRREAPPGTVDVLAGKCVFEIKPAGIDKGTGLRTLMGHASFRGRRPIFLGDDVTDESAFAVLPEFDGVGIAVGKEMPGAVLAFQDPTEVRAWLANIAKLKEPAG